MCMCVSVFVWVEEVEIGHTSTEDDGCNIP